ncbi:putative MFS transporter [Aspergillus ibericus CBS 121593]|uniref:MFS transporter n=1 Tax=Aspergillus ibericus CBS 121593 TaxID=1448316 RepID=A0A395GVX3_9EURO|nr:MFS transporter [Aspergillus ibericus CBS 121593]RAK99529.1 MFS transporter [Aspergillus ibericus CBS 121593]
MDLKLPTQSDIVAVLEKQTQSSTEANDLPIEQHGTHVHPTPTSDPLDPLNWSQWRKHTVLGIVMFKYFLFTYITTTTVPSFAEIQLQYDINYSQVNWTVAIPALGLSLGPLFWSSLADIYGRRIVFIVGSIIALVSTIGVAVAGNYSGYMAGRFFQGIGVSPASSVGMAIVTDLFFDYERGQKLGLWVLAIDSGLLLGPPFGGFLNLVSAQWTNWFNAILFATLLVLELALMPETLYPRAMMLQRLSATEKPSVNGPCAEETGVKRTKSLPFLNITPIPGLAHPPIYASLTRFFLTFRFSVIPVAVLGYSFTWYWWMMSVITMVPSAYASDSPLIQGLLFLGLLIGSLIAEVGCSGRLSDAIVERLAKRNGGIRAPEMRLWLAYPAIGLTVVGLIVWGISVDKAYHWIVGQMAFFLFSAGIQIGNTVTSSYIIDAYPLQSSSVVIFYAVFLNLSAFANPFFIAQWEAAVGWTWTFTTQALITLVAGTGIFVSLHVFGPSWRARAVPGWVNPEFDS